MRLFGPSLSAHTDLDGWSACGSAAGRNAPRLPFRLIDGVPKPKDNQARDAMMALAMRSTPVRNALAKQYGLLGEVLCHETELQHAGIDLPSAHELSYLFVCLMYGHWKMVASLGLAEEHKFVARSAMDRLLESCSRSASPYAQGGDVETHYVVSFPK